MRIAPYTTVLTVACLLLCHAALAMDGTFFVAFGGNDDGPGTMAMPWRTIQRAVDSVQPGDTVLIGPGIYRETVALSRSGATNKPITIAAMEGARVVISGADRLYSGWTPADKKRPIYAHDWPHIFPIGTGKDGKPTLSHPADKQHELIGRAEQVIHDDRLLRQVTDRAQLAPGTFLADVEEKKLYVWLADSNDPNKCDVEASVRSNWLEAKPGVSNVKLRGLVFRYAANHAQRGAFWIPAAESTNSPLCRAWTVDNCVFERANGSGASLSGVSHVFRRCSFHDNGQLGFGAYRCHETRMEKCDIFRNNAKGYSTGWEAGGLKVVLSRGFAFDRCRAVDNRGPGIWFDIGNEASVVKKCYIADNDEAGIFYEISYGLHAHDNLIVNNANRGEEPGASWGMGGITLSSSEDCLVENNTIVGNRDGIALREQKRATQRIDEPAGETKIFNRNHRIRYNIVAYSQVYNLAFWFDTTFFGLTQGGHEQDDTVPEDPKTLDIGLAYNMVYPLPGRPNYLYGVPWRPGSRVVEDPAGFAQASGLEDTSKIMHPMFIDAFSGDYRLRRGAPSFATGVGARSLDEIPSATGATLWY